MARSRDERAEYVVELVGEAVAVVHVRAESADDAAALAEERVRPVDVTEFYEISSTLVTCISAPAAAVGAARSPSARESAPKGRRRGRQA